MKATAMQAAPAMPKMFDQYAHAVSFRSRLRRNKPRSLRRRPSSGRLVLAAQTGPEADSYHGKTDNRIGDPDIHVFASPMVKR